MSTGRKVALAISLAVMAVAVPIAVIYGAGWIKMISADFRGDVGVNEQISADAEYRIAQYEWFFDQCAAVQTKEAELAAAQVELEAEGLSDYRRQQLSTNIAAITAARAELINEYNAEAQKEDTAANFLASNLPFELNINTEETTCAA